MPEEQAPVSLQRSVLSHLLKVKEVSWTWESEHKGLEEPLSKLSGSQQSQRKGFRSSKEGSTEVRELDLTEVSRGKDIV